MRVLQIQALHPWTEQADTSHSPTTLSSLQLCVRGRRNGALYTPLPTPLNTHNSHTRTHTHTNFLRLNLQAAAGYKLNFRNTHTTVVGMADTYGGVRTSIERELLKDTKLQVYLHYNPYVTQANPRDSEVNCLGFKLSIGQQPKLDLPMSPCTMNRTAFKIQ